jgi:Tol biopolymer transport system component
MANDGTEETQLTDSPFEDKYPAWSPRGDKIAFESQRDCAGHVTYLNNQCTSEIYVMDANGENQTRVTNDPNFASHNPQWSPDGEQITYWRLPATAPGPTTIWVMNSNGSDNHQISSATDPHPDFLPAWSPDGQWIAFSRANIQMTSQQSGNLIDANIWAMKPDGSHVTGPFNDSQFADLDVFANWSPDNQSLVFSSGRECQVNSPLTSFPPPPVAFKINNCVAQLYRMPIDENPRSITAGGPQQITHSPGTGTCGAQCITNFHPAFSPNGDRVAFFRQCSPASCDDRHSEIFQLCFQATSCAPDQLTDTTRGDNRANSANPDWQPIVQEGTAESVIISEFRSRGPGGAADEFYELYNQNLSPVTVNATDGSGGWSLATRNGQFVTIPNGTVIPANGHYLIANTGYSLTGYPGGPTAASTTAPDRTYTGDVPDGLGVALFNTATPANYSSTTLLDAVGGGGPNFAAETNSLFREGNGYRDDALFSQLSAPSQVESTLFRRLFPRGTPKDTGDNLADVQGLETRQSGATGQPGPENAGSPVQRNDQVSVSLFDPAVPESAAPNQVRESTTGTGDQAHGTLLIRRTITNERSAPITRLRFRVAQISGAATGEADVAFIDAPGPTLVPRTPPGAPGLVEGTTFERPAGNARWVDGKLNSSVGVSDMALTTPLGTGQSLNFQVRLAIRTTGKFHFLANVEALP